MVYLFVIKMIFQWRLPEQGQYRVLECLPLSQSIHQRDFVVAVHGYPVNGGEYRFDGRHSSKATTTLDMCPDELEAVISHPSF
jgi:hypothetical protein